ncbi:MAG: hypothetical protein MZV64_43915 [Ignavibacteriales bacterium]|nr:hypothetical protein [Ignavibacteriales bacterium]
MVQVGYNVFDIQEPDRARSRPIPTISRRAASGALHRARSLPGRRRHRHEDAQGRRPAPGPREIPDRPRPPSIRPC